MHREDRTLIMHIDTGGLTVEEEDRLVAALLRVAAKHSVAHVELPLRNGHALPQYQTQATPVD